LPGALVEDESVGGAGVGVGTGFGDGAGADEGVVPVVDELAVPLEVPAEEVPADDVPDEEVPAEDVLAGGVVVCVCAV
jgi:hypothetical protein